MDTIKFLIGTGKELNSLQMSLRSVIVFLLALLMLRVAGVRTFGKRSTFDMVIMIMLGGLLSRTITGSSPFVPTIMAGFVLVIIHRLVGLISFKNRRFDDLVNGRKTLLYKNGRAFEKNMRQAEISEDDVKEEIRIQLNQEGVENIEEVWLEKSGNISIIKGGASGAEKDLQ